MNHFDEPFIKRGKKCAIVRKPDISTPGRQGGQCHLKYTACARVAAIFHHFLAKCYSLSQVKGLWKENISAPRLHCREYCFIFQKLPGATTLKNNNLKLFLVRGQSWLEYTALDFIDFHYLIPDVITPELTSQTCCILKNVLSDHIWYLNFNWRELLTKITV